MTITPSESTHFRVILSSEAMENETQVVKEAGPSSSVCAIVKPEPRTPITTATPGNPQGSVVTVSSVSPVTPTEPLDVLPSNMATSTPSNSQQSDSPSKKKGKLITFQVTILWPPKRVVYMINSYFVECRCPEEESASGT